MHVKVADLSVLVEIFWQTEELHNAVVLSNEEQMCEKIFNNTHTCDKTLFVYRSMTRLNSLGKSEAIALRQFYAMERKMQRNAESRAKYSEFINEFLSLNHMIEWRFNLYESRNHQHESHGYNSKVR